MSFKESAVPVQTPRRFAVMVFVLVLLLVTAIGSQAQSGRRPPQQQKLPDPIPSKQEDPPIAAPSDKDAKPQTRVMVVWHLKDPEITTIYSHSVQDGFLERLSQAGSVKPGTGQQKNRMQAIEFAKASTDTYVLSFVLLLDEVLARHDRDRASGRVPTQYYFVHYEIFTPGTGKTKASGNVYQRLKGVGGVSSPIPQTPLSADSSLRYAGSEMADRLLDVLGLPHPARR